MQISLYYMRLGVFHDVDDHNSERKSLAPILDTNSLRHRRLFRLGCYAVAK